jgi:Orn/Lys/Arg decarboxylase, N-terminal domain
VQTGAAIGCLVVDWGKKGLEDKAASLINLMRRRDLEMPIVLLVRHKRFEDVPVEVLPFLRASAQRTDRPLFEDNEALDPANMLHRRCEQVVHAYLKVGRAAAQVAR